MNRHWYARSRRRLFLESLEGRRLLASFTYKTISGNGPDDVTLGFNAATSNYEIRTTLSGALLASKKNTSGLTDISIIGNAEADTLRLAPTFFAQAKPLNFSAGAGSDTIGAEADANFALTTMSLTIGAFSVMFSGVENAALMGGAGDNTLDITGFDPASGGSVTLVGRAGNDTYREGTSHLTVTIIDSSGSELYALQGSTVTVIDEAGGDDTIDLGDGAAGASVTLADDGGSGTMGDSSFSFQGEFENIQLTDHDDNFVTSTTTVNQNVSGGGGNDVICEAGDATYVLNGGPGNDTYCLQGSTVTVIDEAGGDDTIDFGDGDAGASITLADDGGSATMGDGSFSFQGEFENVQLTDHDDTFSTSTSTVNQTVSGAGGNDVICEAGDATYVLDGGPGNDTYCLQGSTVTVIDEAGGDDTIDFGDGDAGASITLADDGGSATMGDGSFSFQGEFENVQLTDHDDTFSTSTTTVNQTVSGAGGNDVICEAGDATYVLNGGPGNDTYCLQGSTVTVIDEAGGDDTIDFGDGDAGATVTLADDGGSATMGDGSFSFQGEFENVQLTDHDDNFSTSTTTVNQTVSGAGGNDVICEAGDATYVLDGGPGNDTYCLQGSTVTVIDLAGGDDTIDFSMHEEGISLTLSDDGGEATGSFFSFTGNFETVFGSPAADKITSHTSSSRKIHGQAGNDEYVMHGFHQTSDSAGDDIYRTASQVEIEDNVGGNVLDVRSFAGGAPGAECGVNGACIEVTDAGGTAVSGDGTLNVSVQGSISTVLATEFDDRVLVLTSSGSASIHTFGGADRIDGLSSLSSDTFDGGPGNDQMLGGPGNHTYLETPGSADVIVDTGGIDTIDFSGASQGVTFSLSLTAGQVQSVDSAGNTVAVTGTLENVIGTEFADNLTGNGLANFMSGLGGDDQLIGQSGRDVLIGGSGADRLVGSSGVDILIAGNTDYDRHDAALRVILSEWSSAPDTAAGVARLRSGSIVLADGTVVLLQKSVTVFDDADDDQITGSNGPDWLFFDDEDVVTDLDPTEDVINDGPAP